jgi:hypothetical protein
MQFFVLDIFRVMRCEACNTGRIHTQNTRIHTTTTRTTRKVQLSRIEKAGF